MRALIVGNGEPPSRSLFDALRQPPPDLLLCADGGADTVRAFGQRPDVVIGDLDSVSGEDDAGTRRVRVDADNTGTDLNKVLRWAVDAGVTEATLTGVTGRRTDHTLWNLSQLKVFAPRLRLRIVDDHCAIHLVEGGDGRRFRAEIGQLISLAPLDGVAHDIWTEGLRWELAGDSLAPGERDGISNEVVASPVSVRLGGGDLLLIVQREGPGGGEVAFL